jgi:hypothetical protein
MLQETFCYGDVLLRRHFVWRRFVEETFCAETSERDRSGHISLIGTEVTG